MQLPMEITNPLQRPSWNDLVTASKDYSFFHSANWARVLHESYGYNPIYLTVTGNDRLRTLIPVMDVKSFLTGSRGVSLPFTDYCEPIAETADCVREGLKYLIDYGKSAGWKYIDFRGEKYFPHDVPTFSSYYAHVLTLSEEERIISGFQEHNWRNIKTAYKKGVVAEVSTSLESVKDFYDLHCVTRKSHGVPPQPIHFFMKIHEHIILKNLGFVVLASSGGKYIAGGVFFHFGDQALFKYGASDHSYRSLCGNNLVIWEAIKVYAAKGYKSICFGRTDLNEEGLRQFKKAWGTEERIIKYFRYDLHKEEFVSNCPAKNETIRRILRKVPVPILRIAGTLFYRHIG